MSTDYRYAHPISICTLADEPLREILTAMPELQGILIAPLYTENLGIEHIIEFALDQPDLRFLLLCGEDARQTIGHLPGQTLLALARHGMDKSGRIIQAPGKRPFIHNIPAEAVDFFRKTVDVVDLVDERDPQVILAAFRACLARNPGSRPSFQYQKSVPLLGGEEPAAMMPDPGGYFIIEIDRTDKRLILKHYENTGRLNLIVKGKTGPELYFTAFNHGLVTRMDHAAYLGRELYRAEYAMRFDEPYVQDESPFLAKADTD